MAAKTTRKLEVWTFHAHLGSGADVDYEELFQALRQLPRDARQARVRDRSIAIPQVDRWDDDVFQLQAYEGELAMQPLIYDVRTGEERYADTTSSEFVATKTHALFNVRTREAIVEYNRRGAKASDIAAVIARSLSRTSSWPDLTLELATKVDDSFVEAIDAFERVREIVVRLTKPNYGWGDIEHAVADVADQSDAGAYEVSVKAARGQSLSKARGLFPTVKQLVRETRSSISRIAVTGSREGDAGETTVSTTSHTAHKRTRPEIDERGQVVDTDIEKEMRDYDVERRRSRGPGASP